MTPLNSGVFKMTENIGRLWCRLIHDAPMWPIHGHYQCRTCNRQYSVPWAETAASELISTHHRASLSFGRLRRAA
jgi:hypothetical protein